MSRAVVWDGKIVYPLIVPTNKPSIAYASPVSAPGTWTVENAGTESTTCQYPTLLVDGARLYLWWVSYPKRIRYAWKDPGTLWSIATFYDGEAVGSGYIDPATDLLVPWPSENFFHAPSMSKLSNGMFHVMLNGYQTDPASILFQLQEEVVELPCPQLCCVEDSYLTRKLPEVDTGQTIPNRFGFVTWAAYSQSYGPWKSGTDLYCFGKVNWTGTGNIYRSTDSGQTWAAMDVANSTTEARAPWFDEPNQRITVACKAASGAVYLKDFDIATNTWGANYATSGAMTGNVNYLIGKADGSKVVFLGFLAATWNGSTWTSVTFITPSTGTILTRGAALETTSQNVHGVWAQQAVFNGPTVYYHRVLKNDGTLGSITTLDTYPYNGTKLQTATGPCIFFFNGKVYILFVRGWDYFAKVGTPASLPTAFTESAIASASNPVADQGTDYNTLDLGGCISADGSKLIVLYTDQNGQIGDDATCPTMRIYRRESADGTTWSAPVLHFDFWGSSLFGGMITTISTAIGIFLINCADIGFGVNGIAAFAAYGNSGCLFYMMSGCMECEEPTGGALRNYAYHG